jgi:hypothetical protein
VGPREEASADAAQELDVALTLGFARAQALEVASLVAPGSRRVDAALQRRARCAIGCPRPPGSPRWSTTSRGSRVAGVVRSAPSPTATASRFRPCRRASRRSGCKTKPPRQGRKRYRSRARDAQRVEVVVTLGAGALGGAQEAPTPRAKTGRMRRKPSAAAGPRRMTRHAVSLAVTRHAGGHRAARLDAVVTGADGTTAPHFARRMKSAQGAGQCRRVAADAGAVVTPHAEARRAVTARAAVRA